MIKIFISLLIFISPLSLGQRSQKPKLIIGIVVDQMRFDYLTRFNKYFGEEGFKRLIKEGSNFTYAHFNYVPTYTAPGHTSIYTGTTPFFHGIIGNNWYDKTKDEMVSSVWDNSFQSVGVQTNEGQRSPGKILSNTITDQLKIATNGKSKVISVSIKDRAAILPGGHSADLALWYSTETGKFITSDYYVKSLPKWVDYFNNSKLPDKYISQLWTLSLPASDYLISSPDESVYEKDTFNEGKTSFPHSLKNVPGSSKYSAIIKTPFGNQLVLELAKAAVINESLGKNTVTDFLAISFSSTDYIGHEYGPNSVEIEDTYIKLDKQIADLLSSLDNLVGKGNYLLFLTADHAVMESPGYLRKLKINGENFESKRLNDSLQSFAEKKYNNENIILNTSNRQIFLNFKLLREKKFNPEDVENNLKEYLLNAFPEIAMVWTKKELLDKIAERTSNNLILNGFNFKRSGDIAFEFEPNIIPDHKKGSTHGSIYKYDTHVPMIFFGWHIPHQKINTPVYTVDIAPTIANLIGITEPNACIGIPLIKPE
jgi:predicted AlkP superfamily pyrophosphatase or phosphodiesterase